MEENEQKQPTFSGVLIPALMRAQKNFKPVAKTKTGQVGNNRKYKYADLSDVLAMALPCLNEEGILFSQTFKREGEKLYLITRLAKDSETLDDAGLLVPESGVTNQELGMRLTYIRRYSASAILGIATEDDTDGAPPAAEEPSSSGQVAKTPYNRAPKPELFPNQQGVQTSQNFQASDDDVPSVIGDKPDPAQRKEFQKRIKTFIESEGVDAIKGFVKKTTGSESTTNLTAREWSEILAPLDEAQKNGTLKELVK